MGLPVHSFTFLRKAPFIVVIYPSDIIKKNTVSLRNAVENDIFNIAPDTSPIYLLEEESKHEANGKQKNEDRYKVKSEKLKQDKLKTLKKAEYH